MSVTQSVIAVQCHVTFYTVQCTGTCTCIYPLKLLLISNPITISLTNQVQFTFISFSNTNYMYVYFSIVQVPTPLKPVYNTL